MARGCETFYGDYSGEGEGKLTLEAAEVWRRKQLKIKRSIRSVDKKVTRFCSFVPQLE